MLKSPNTAILIKDEARNVFYELEDVRDIQDRSVIKIYRKEPIYASYPAAPHLANGDLRVGTVDGAQISVTMKVSKADESWMVSECFNYCCTRVFCVSR